MHCANDGRDPLTIAGFLVNLNIKLRGKTYGKYRARPDLSQRVQIKFTDVVLILNRFLFRLI